MKHLFPALLALAFISSPAFAAEPSADRAVVLQLSVIKAQKSMLALCDVAEGEASALLAKHNEQEEKLLASLSADSKEKVAAELDKIQQGVSASWEQTPKEQREKSCEALKASLAK